MHSNAKRSIAAGPVSSCEGCTCRKKNGSSFSVAVSDQPKRCQSFTRAAKFLSWNCSATCKLINTKTCRRHVWTMVRAAFRRCLIQRRMNSDEQCLKAAKSIPHISKEQVLVRFESFWYNFGTILSESTLRMLWYLLWWRHCAAFILVLSLDLTKKGCHVSMLCPTCCYIHVLLMSLPRANLALPRTALCVRLPLCARSTPQFCGWRWPCLPPFPNKACKCLAEGGSVAYLNMLSEPLSNQSVKFAV